MANKLRQDLAEFGGSVKHVRGLGGCWFPAMRRGAVASDFRMDLDAAQLGDHRATIDWQLPFSCPLLRRAPISLGFAGARGVSEVGVSCCVLVLVDQSTEDITAAQPAEVRRTPCLTALRRHRRRVGQAPVRAPLVVMLDVASEDANELLATDDQQLVQALPADRADPALSDGVRVGRLHRCADDLDTGRAPHVIERPGELGVPVADQERERGGLVIEDGREVTSLLGNPPPSRMTSDARRCTRRLASSTKNRTYTRRKKTVSTVKKSQATIPVACWRRNDRQLVWTRRGAGSRP